MLFHAHEKSARVTHERFGRADHLVIQRAHQEPERLPGQRLLFGHCLSEIDELPRREQEGQGVGSPEHL